MSYTIKKTGALWQVLSASNVVQFSSLERANCTRWAEHVQETQAQKEARFCRSR